MDFFDRLISNLYYFQSHVYAILLNMAGVQIAHANRTFFSFSECYISASNIGSVSDEVASPAIRTVRSNSDFYT